MIIDCIADLHGHYPKLEGGDLLIIAGDLTSRDILKQYSDFMEWLENQKYKRKILVAGNHDNEIQDGLDFDFPDLGIEYLEDSGTEFEGLKIWGSPWTLKFPGMNTHCMAFTCDTEEELAEKWAKIPDDLDILITHGPPHQILDEVKRFDYPETKTRIGYFLNNQFEHTGSESLRHSAYRCGCQYHIFGHIHEGYGILEKETHPTFINCSLVNENYRPINKPVRVIL